MPLHVLRNSFNAGEISPLMDARTDAERYGFSCRKLESFIPRVYGGAFRRPGMVRLEAANRIARWEELDVTVAGASQYGFENAPGTSTIYQEGDYYLHVFRTAYICGDASEGAANWVLASNQNDLYHTVDIPGPDDDNTQGWSVNSLIFSPGLDIVWKCLSASTGAAVWEAQLDEKNNLHATVDPLATDDETEGYAVNSIWIKEIFTLYRLDDKGPPEVWNTVTETIQPRASRPPLGIDDDSDGWEVGSVWVDNRSFAPRWILAELDAEGPGVRMEGFNISASDRYMLEMGHGYLRVWEPDGTLFDDPDDPGTPLELATPYAADELEAVKFVQLNSVAFLTHPDHPLQILTRSYDAGIASYRWTWEGATLSNPAFRSTNQTAVTATPDGTTGLVTIAFSEDIFTETLDYSLYEGAKIKLTHRREASFVDLSLNSSGTSAALEVLGSFSMTTYGTWDGTLIIQRRDASGSWEDVRTFTSDEDRNIAYDSLQEQSAELRLSYTGTGTTARAVLEVDDSRIDGVATILSISFANSLPVVTCLVDSDFNSTDATTEWALDAWAPYSGFPRAITFHEQRLWLAGTELEPNTVWASRVDDFLNFRRGIFDADSLSFTLAAQEGSSIQSLLSHEALVMFTQTEEWTATTSEQTAITPSNIFVRRQSRFGSALLQSLLANNNLLFLQRGGRKLREFAYSATTAGGTAEDLSVLAEHITEGGVKQIAFQQQPDPIIWLVLHTGELISLTYESQQVVIAWARHPTDGTVESVGVIYGEGDAGDEVWFAVDRGGATQIERFDPDYSQRLEDEDVARMIYLDSAVSETFGAPTDTLTGLDHLEGREVSILADGFLVPAQTVTGGQITLDNEAVTITAGLPYTSVLQPSKQDIPLDNGTSQDRTWVCKRLNLNLWKTKTFEYADSPSAPDNEWFDGMTGDDLFTGLSEVNNMGSHRENVDVTLRQRLPLPLNVLAIVAKLEIYGE